MASIGFPHDGVLDDGWKIWLVGTVFPAVNLILLTLRLRWRSSHDSLGRDDALIFVAFVFSIAMTVFMDLAIANGFGKRQSALTVDQTANAVMFFYIDQIFYKLVVMFAKISILALYLRIFSQSKFARWGSAIMIAVVVLWSTASILMTTMQCLPVQAVWDKSIKGAKCLDRSALWMQYAVINPATDLVILLLPVRDVFRLHVPWKQKIGLLAMFSIGILTCAISIGRLVAVINLDPTMDDITSSYTTLSCLTLAEANAGIFCACLLALRAFFRRGLRHLRSSRGEDSTAWICAPRHRPRRYSKSPDWWGAAPGKTLSELSAASGFDVEAAERVTVPEKVFLGGAACAACGRNGLVNACEGEEDEMVIEIERGHTDRRVSVERAKEYV